MADLGERGTNSSLLLRLFKSSFFTLPLAIQYLERFPNSIGITSYLVQRLDSFAASQIEFYWPQLCYLLITRPSASVALENYILRKSQEDLHLAIITLWYMQSSLHDISTAALASTSSGTTTTNSIISSPQFKVCHRMSNSLQALIFTDPPAPTPVVEPPPVASTSGSKSLMPKFITRNGARKQKLNSPIHTLIGVSVMASAIGLPNLLVGEDGLGEMLIDQARNVLNDVKEAAEDSDDERSGSDSETEGVPVRASSSKPPPTASKPRRARSNLPAALSYVPGAPLDRSSSSFAPRASTSLPTIPRTTISTRLLPRSTISIHHTQSSPYLSSPSSPFALGDSTTPRSSNLHRPAASTPYLLLSSPLINPASTLPEGAAGLPLPFLSHLLRLQSVRAQLDLFRSLNLLANTLIAVPKGGAREASLRAEIMSLNHRLSSSSGCCLGMGCFGVGDYYSHTCGTPESTLARDQNSQNHRPHSRIVRISPSESVVLNSADRAPFVLHVEVLEGDLDFDPQRKGNREDVKRVLEARERGRSGTPLLNADREVSSLSQSSSITGTPSTVQSTNAPTLPSSPLVVDTILASTALSNILVITPPPPSSLPNDDDEVDLVEQLYGNSSAHVSLFGQSPTAISPEEQAIHNRALDEAAWSLTQNTSRSSPTVTPKSSTAFLPSFLPPPLSVPTPANSRRSSANGISSLDDYSSRMRTAAIMLSQLSAAQQLSTTTTSLNTLSALSPVSVVTGIGGVVGAGLGAGLGGLGAIWERYGSSSVKTLAPSRSSSALSAAERQRILSFNQASAIRNRIMQEMIQLEEERMARLSMNSGRKFNSQSSGKIEGEGMEDVEVVKRAVNKEDPSGAVFRESFAAKTARIRASSPYGHLPNWNVVSVIVKTGADLRQEQLAIQLISEFGRIWEEEKCPSYVRYFKILVTSESSGLIETITDAVSVHSIKKDAYTRTTSDGTLAVTTFSLYDHYVETFGPPTSAAFRKAQDAFMKSLASYSVICYLLQLKDRHNGNILVDKVGHLIHIDFGFLLSNSPGSIGFEMAPFKFSADYIDILGGLESAKFLEFKVLFKRAFKEARKHAERIITLVELMQKDSNLPCFANGVLTSQQLRERFQLTLSESQLDEFAERIILNSLMSNFTRLYDLFQYHSNGIL